MTYKNLKKPFIISLPIALGYIPLGIVCGMLLNNAGLNPYLVVAMSFLVFAGARHINCRNKIKIYRYYDFSWRFGVYPISVRHDNAAAFISILKQYVMITNFVL